MNYLTTRARLILLIIAAALPALGLSVYHGLERRSEAEANAHEDLERGLRRWPCSSRKKGSRVCGSFCLRYRLRLRRWCAGLRLAPGSSRE